MRGGSGGTDMIIHTFYRRWRQGVIVTPRPRPVYPEERLRSSQCIGSLVGPNDGLVVLKGREISYPCRESKHSSSVFLPITVTATTLLLLLLLHNICFNISTWKFPNQVYERLFQYTNCVTKQFSTSVFQLIVMICNITYIPSKASRLRY